MLYRLGCALLIVAVNPLTTHAREASLQPLESLGKQIFFDERLSDPPGQSCASCHSPASGWTGDTSEINAHAAVYPGAIETRFGNRKPPSAAYATFSPVFHYDKEEGLFIGGNFWDGRATGWLLGDPVAEQAQGPFLNPVEQNIQNAKRAVGLVCQSDYAPEFQAIFGEEICNNTINAYNAIAKAVAAYEASSEVNAFTSKYDYYLKDPEQYPLSKEEMLGLRIFEDEQKGNCAACHPNKPAEDGVPPLFTDFSYDNLGVPRNPENAWYQMPKEINPDTDKWIDPGLGGFLAKVPNFAGYAPENRGKHKVPTLRNVDLRPDPSFVKAYGHNGYFKSLKEIVHFYNTRDGKPSCAITEPPQPGVNCWPAPEVIENLNKEELGNLGLTEAEEWALVAFMKTLSDTWAPPK
ncbi:MAG: cytochrome C [Candidatus Thiodiazotropha lotti]|nr:cytochrome C [Candidatus Thiodiazotropha lotti]MCG8002763.1 cytochrome C [Candidatus Thiodiazotropha lotti]MCG8007109.1 cytochrome C [Candidatus Thiodiazotropha lotti]MCW4186383.1 cytochrome C [Candidatus Thiodiazotropha lotti]MCW4194690.1 cytochrome C [Candidatus Thiodiazotropha lotti]